jgi:pimeloyl-ACP methyl ester carboxylesterase
LARREAGKILTHKNFAPLRQPPKGRGRHRYGWVLLDCCVDLKATKMNDDDLELFEANGAPPLPSTAEHGYTDRGGASIWYASFGAGSPVILLHGGLGHSGNWGHQVPDLIAAGHRVIVIDSRGHGRSTRDARPFSYELMASDVWAVMDQLGVRRAALVGWSDGAIIALIMADKAPERVTGVFFFACKMDPSGNKRFEPSPTVQRCFNRHSKDYAALSAAPETFKNLVAAVSLMQRTQPNYSDADLARIRPPVRVVQAEHDEFIKSEHSAYLAKSIPNATHSFLADVSHFAPLQRPEQFNAELQDFLGTITRT